MLKCHTISKLKMKNILSRYDKVFAFCGSNPNISQDIWYWYQVYAEIGMVISISQVTTSPCLKQFRVSLYPPEYSSRPGLEHEQLRKQNLILLSLFQWCNCLQDRNRQHQISLDVFMIFSSTLCHYQSSGYPGELEKQKSKL